MTTATATLHELQHDFGTVEKSAVNGSVNVLRHGRVVGTFVFKKNTAKNWPEKPDFAGRAIKTRGGPVNMIEYLDR